MAVREMRWIHTFLKGISTKGNANSLIQAFNFDSIFNDNNCYAQEKKLSVTLTDNCVFGTDMSKFTKQFSSSHRSMGEKELVRVYEQTQLPLYSLPSLSLPQRDLWISTLSQLSTNSQLTNFQNLHIFICSKIHHITNVMSSH